MFAEIATNVLYNFDAGLLTSFVSALTALSIGFAAVVTTAPKIKKVRIDNYYCSSICK